MDLRAGIRRIAFRAVISLTIAAWILGATLRVGRSVHADQAAPNSTRTVQLGEGRPGNLYAITVAVKDPAQVQGDAAVQVAIKDAQGEVQSKWLHAADLDFYMTIRPRSAGRVSVNLSAAPDVRIPEIAATMNKIPEPSPASINEGKLDRGVIAAGPNGTWQAAQPFELGQTVFGSDDERPYAPAKNEDGYAAMVKGFQWLRFTFRENQPRLVYFVLNVTDRDVPFDVDIFQLGKDSDGRPDVVPFTDGEFVYKVEATQNYPGLYKFRTRILQPGQEYYVRVAAESSGLPVAHLSVRCPADEGSARGGARGHGLPGQHGRQLALKHAAPGRHRLAHHHAALRDPAVHRLPPYSIHYARLSEGGARMAMRPRSAPASSFSPIAFTTTPGRSMESPTLTGYASSTPPAPYPAACR